jgi:hypothetical protein
MEVNGNLIVFKVRANGSGAAFKQLVCTDNVQFKLSSSITTKKTSCGIKTSVSDPTFEISGSGVFQIDPLATQVTWDDIVGWQKDNTKLDFQFVNLADVGAGLTEGEAVSELGSGYFNDSTFTGNAEDGFATFDFNFSGTGTLGSYDI